jgi:hypothetical protein
MERTDEDLQKEVEEALAEAKRTKVRRREMVSGQIKKTLQGDIIFKLTVDLPTSVSEDDFKRYMREYGNIIVEAFNA